MYWKIERKVNGQKYNKSMKTLGIDKDLDISEVHFLAGTRGRPNKFEKCMKKDVEKTITTQKWLGS